MIAICGSAMRTGSVALWQLMRALVERAAAGETLPLGSYTGTKEEFEKWARGEKWTVVKLHYPLDPLGGIDTGRVKAAVIMRDIRDVVVSLMNFNKWEFETAFHARGIKGNVTALAMWRDLLPPENLLVLRYDDFVTDRTAAGMQIVELLDLGLEEKQVDTIQKQWDIKANKKRAEKGHPLGHREFMSKRHINSGESGQWRHTLNPKQVAIVEEEYGEWLVENGFELS